MELLAGLLASMKLMKGVGVGGGRGETRGPVTQAGNCHRKELGEDPRRKDCPPFWAPRSSRTQIRDSGRPESLGRRVGGWRGTSTSKRIKAG